MNTPASANRSFGYVRKALALLMLTCQNTALVLTLKFSYRKGAEPYLVSTVIVCSESLKLSLSLLLLAYTEGRSGVVAAVRELRANSLRLILPSALYLAQNSLLFCGIRLLTPTSYTVCSQIKILTSAIFSVLLLNQKVTRRQYLALFALTVGMVMVQLEDGASRGIAEGSHSTGSYQMNSSSLRGVLSVLAAALTSGFSGAYLERMYKEGSHANRTRTIWFRNAQLACISVPLAVATAIYRDHESLQLHGAFQGCDTVVLFVVLLQAAGGMIVAFVLRYAGNILKCFAVSISICVCVLVNIMSTPALPVKSGISIGVPIVILSIFVYSSSPKKET